MGYWSEGVPWVERARTPLHLKGRQCISVQYSSCQKNIWNTYFMIQTIRQECHVRNTCLNVVSLAVVYLLKCCKGSPSLKNVGSIWALPK